MTAARAGRFESFRWVLIGNVAIAASQWGIVVMLARYTAPEILGAYAIGLSAASVVFGLANLELRTLQVTDPAQHTSFPTYFLLRALTGLTGVFALGLAAAILPHSFITSLAMAAVATTKCLDGISDIIYGRLQVCETMAPIGKSQLTKAVLSLGLLGVALAVVRNPIVAIGATVAPSAAVLFFYDIPNLRRHGRTSTSSIDLGFGRTMRKLAALARSGLPLTAVTTMVMLHGAIPRLAVGRELGAGVAGITAALSYLALAPNMLMVALGQSTATTLVRSVAAGDRKGYRRGILQMLGVALVMGVAALLTGYYLGSPILSLCYGPRFLGHERELLFFLAAGAVSYLNTALGYGLSSARVFSAQIPIMAIVCAASLGTSLAWAPVWGISGAAASQLISMLVQLLLGGVLLTKTVASRFSPAGSVRGGVSLPAFGLRDIA